MSRDLSLVIVFCFMSGCATRIEDNQSKVLETQPVVAPTAEIQPVDTNAPVESLRDESNQPSAAKRALSKKEIKSLQIELKGVGFDPGALDGVLGANTMSAFRRLQSACVNLKDLFQYSGSGKQPMTERDWYDRTVGPDEIRLIQVRLKDAGFNVGSIDGVMGHKTRSALTRFQSGCTAIKDLPVSLEAPVQKVETAPIPGSRLEKRVLPALSKPISAIAPVRDETTKLSIAEEQIPRKEEIRLVQEQLKAAGFDPGPLDGILGPKTKLALQQYQTATGSATSRRLSSSIGLKSDY